MAIARPAEEPRSRTLTPAKPGGGSLPARGTPIPGRRWGVGRATWFLLLPFCFVVYASSFRDFPILERRHSVLADADAANFAVLLRDFSLGRKYGNEYTSVGRSLGDNAQKHKIHHAPYALIGAPIHGLFRGIYPVLGLPREQALYAVNALIACVNLVLLALLLARFNPSGNSTLPFLAFYAVSLSTWVYSSIPESWPFTATLVLAYFLLLGRRDMNPIAMGVALGLVMLNNLFMSVLAVLLVVGFARNGATGRVLARKTVAAGVASVATWLAGLSVFSLFDDSFRPDNFVRYTLWFRDFTTGNFLTPSDPYVWMSAGTNLLINSVVSNQPDPAVPQEALLLTLQNSVLGALTVGAFLCLVGVAIWGMMRTEIRSLRRGGWKEALRDPALDLPIWCVTVLVLTALVFYPSGFLYSTVVVPIIAVFLCRYLDLRVPWQGVLFYGSLILMAFNNASQILLFREALRNFL